MYLVHVELRPPLPGAMLPADAAVLVRGTAEPYEAVEHVVAHRTPGHPQVLGVFLLATGLAEAEQRAAGLGRRALAQLDALAGWSLGPVGVPLVAPFYERLLSVSGPAGRNGPGPFPST